MNKNYMIIGIAAVGGIALASSSYFLLDSEQKSVPVVENIQTQTAEQVFQETVTQIEKIEVESFVDEADAEQEVAAEEVDVILPPGVTANISEDLYDGPQTFWEVDETDQGNDPEVYALKVDPKMIANLQVGQTFDFFVPELNQTFQTDINNTKNSFNGTHIFKGEITEGRFGENISIVRGKNLTFITVATLQGVFSATVDNVTGETTLQSEASLNKNLTGDDGIEIDGTEILPPERI